MTDIAPPVADADDAAYAEVLATVDQPEPQPTHADLFQYLRILDQKITWICTTLEWMGGVFQGLQAAASMMPGKAGKIAAQMTQRAAQNGGNGNG